MGNSCFNIQIGEAIKIFNEQLLEKDDKNTEIDIYTDYCQLYNIGQKGFELFCTLSLLNLEYLYLNKNKISDIKYFENFSAPKLIKLDLSSNLIEKIDVFGKVKYPLESLVLSYNKIKDISVFEKESTLPKLRILQLDNNKLDFNDKKTKNIWSKIQERMNNNKKEDSSSDEDEDDKENGDSIRKLLETIKTLNGKFKTDFCIYDKDLVKRIEKMKIPPEERDNYIKEIKLARSPTIKNKSTFKLKEIENFLKTFIHANTANINYNPILHVQKTTNNDQILHGQNTINN
jgi:Leucine-rich repeat (LRR) protein